MMHTTELPRRTGFKWSLKPDSFVLVTIVLLLSLQSVPTNADTSLRRKLFQNEENTKADDRALYYYGGYHKPAYQPKPAPKPVYKPKPAPKPEPSPKTPPSPKTVPSPSSISSSSSEEPVSSSSSSEEPCSGSRDGCTLKFKPVCANGLTYQNKCLAKFAEDGDTKIKDGKCKGDDAIIDRSFFGGTFTDDKDECISKRNLKRFRSQGFKFVGKLKRPKLEDEDDLEPIPEGNAEFPGNDFRQLLQFFVVNRDGKLVTKDTDSLNRPQEDEELPLANLVDTDGPLPFEYFKNDDMSKDDDLIDEGAVRITSNGFAYVADFYDGDDVDSVERSIFSTLAEPDDEPPEEDDEDEYGGGGRERRGIRDLSIIPATDDRIRLQATTSSPYGLMGQINDAKFQCSGSIVGKNKVLTNAHCVYDINLGGWLRPDTFTPGKSSSYEPWGAWDVDYSTYPKRWTNMRNTLDDYAIITLKARSGAGDVAEKVGGHLNIVPAPCSSIDTSTEVVGYPGDKPRGTMWLSTSCTWDPIRNPCERNTGYTLHTCDTFAGSSGSPMVDVGANEVFGVHARGVTTDSPLNGGPVFSAALAAKLQKWAGEEE